MTDTTTTVALGLQVHVGDRPRPRAVRPPQNSDGHAMNKPLGGLWTSSLDHATGGCDWVRFCREGYRDARAFHGWLLSPAPTARLAVVDSHADLCALHARYGLLAAPAGPWDGGLDWERLAADYDGLHLTARGQRETRWPFGSPITLYGWDAESTWWARWMFVGEPVAWHYEVDA